MQQRKIGLRWLNMGLNFTKRQISTNHELENKSKKKLGIYKNLAFGLVIVANTAAAFDYSELNSTIVSANVISSENGVKIEQVIILKDEVKYPIYIIADRYITSNLMDSKEKIDYNIDFAQKTAWIGLAPIIDKMPKEYIISLRNDNKNTQYLFLDPLCPYCQDFVKTLTAKELGDINLNIILTPLYNHGDLAMIKSALIVTENKNAKNDDEKIAILKKYFTSNKETKIANTEFYNKIDDFLNDFFSKKLVTQTPSLFSKPKDKK